MSVESRVQSDLAMGQDVGGLAMVNMAGVIGPRPE